MPRRLRSASLETRTARLKLAQQRKPYFITVASGVALGYRRGAGAGSWNVRAADGKGGNWIKSFAIADDQEDANGKAILDFWQAADKAKALARGGDADAGRPSTVDEALKAYATDLEVRGKGAANASHPRFRLTPALLSRPVSMLTVKELQDWRNDLTKVMKASSVNRICKATKACFTLAAARDDRILNSKAWRVGLAAIPAGDDTESNLVLTDQQRRDLIAAAFALNAEFGLYAEVHAATGARSSQIALLDVGDLQMGAEPKLTVPTSLKGDRTTRKRPPIAIASGLAQRLKQAAAGRGASEPLLLLKGRRWSKADHRLLFAEAAKAANLPSHATMYCLRHTAITNALLANVPVRLVAASFDTSIVQIEKTYSKYIASHGDELMRRVAFDADAPATGGNVVPMVR